jgi:predicted metal-dependent peptidase
MTTTTHTSAAPGEQAKRARDCGLAIGWRYPFFLMTLALVQFKENRSATQTMAIGISGTCYVNPDWTSTLSDHELAGVVCHELMHLMLLHSHRLMSRIPMVWNIATDMAINHILRNMGIRLPASALYPQHGHENSTAEQIYDDLMEDAQQQPQAGAGQPAATAGCGVLSDAPHSNGKQEEEGEEEGESGGQGGGKGDQDSGSGQPGAGTLTAGKTHEQLERLWAEVAVQVMSTAAGTEAGNALVKRLRPPEPRVRWEQVLRASAHQAVASHGRDIQVWSKRSRRSPPGMALPGWTAFRARIAIVIDTSGSMSDDALTRCAAEAGRLGKLSGLGVYLVIHDAVVQHKGWVHVKDADGISRHYRGRGGTDFHPAYAAVEAARAKFDVMVHLTDGEVYRWPEKPANARRLVVAHIGHGECDPPADATVIPTAV